MNGDGNFRVFRSLRWVVFEDLQAGFQILALSTLSVILIFPFLKAFPALIISEPYSAKKRRIEGGLRVERQRFNLELKFDLGAANRMGFVI